MLPTICNASPGASVRANRIAGHHAVVVEVDSLDPALLVRSMTEVRVGLGYEPRDVLGVPSTDDGDVVVLKRSAAYSRIVSSIE